MIGEMQSKRRIELQLAHFKDGCASVQDPASASELAGWVKALEWVLGDEEHRAAYAKFLAELEEAAQLPSAASRATDQTTVRERLMSLSLSMALERLT